MILFIDDSPRYVHAYKDQLEEDGYQVAYFNSVDNALTFFFEHRSSVEIVILDIMMPPGSMYKNANTSNGRSTGVSLFEELRTTVPDLSFIILTNVSDQKVADYFTHQVRVAFCRKDQYFPFELKKVVEVLLGTSSS